MTISAFPEPKTVAELIRVLQDFDGDTPVGAFGPSSMTVYPLYVAFEHGVVQLLGDDFRPGIA